MPINSPASRSAETASKALPRSVRRLKTSIAPMMAKTPTPTDSSTGVTSTPRTWMGCCEIGVGNGRSSRPQTFSATEKKSSPRMMVSRIQPSLFCSSERRTPARSTNSPRRAPRRSPPGTTSQYGSPTLIKLRLKNAQTITSSPWPKLMLLLVAYVSWKPYAMRAYTRPINAPLTVIWAMIDSATDGPRYVWLLRLRGAREPLLVGVVGEDDLPVLHHAHHRALPAERLVRLDVLVVPLAVGMLPGADDAVDGLLQVFESGLDLFRIGAPRLLHRRGEEVDRVVSLGRRDGRRDPVHPIRLVVRLDERLRLGRDRLLDERLGHERAVSVLARVFDEVRHGERPAADERSLKPDLRLAVRHGGELGSDGPDEDGLGAARLRPQQLGGHVLVADVELLGGDDLELVALLVDLVHEVVAPGDAVVGRVVEDGDLGEVPLDRLLDHHLGLDPVVGGEAEDGKLGRLAEPLRHRGRPGRGRDDLGDALLLEMAVAGHHDAGVHRPDHAAEVRRRGQLLGCGGAALVLGLVVALDDLDLHLGAADVDAALGVDLVDGELGAVAHRDPHGRGAAAEGPRDGEVDGIRRKSRQGKSRNQQDREQSHHES